MPRKDPHTGVMVMTFGEFIADIAEKDGVRPEEVLEDIYGQMDADSEAESERLRNPAVAYEGLMTYWDFNLKPDPEYGDWDWFPVKVLRVDHAGFWGGFNGCSSRVNSVVLCSDGETRLLGHRSDYRSGDYINPPEWDEEVYLLEGPIQNLGIS